MLSYRSTWEFVSTREKCRVARGAAECFSTLLERTQKHHFVCKTTKNEQQLLRQNYFRPRHHQLLSWQVPKSEQFPSGFRALPKTHLKPHFAHFCAFLNIFKQNE